jgi:starch-binding outer membrane protein, SusD/RagB family
MNRLLKSNFKRLVIIFFIVSLLPGCEKFLDAKSNQKLAFPTTIKDVQALIDNYSVVNEQGPSAGEASADDYFLTTNSWQTLPTTDLQRLYHWEKDFIFRPGIGNDWSNGYAKIYLANLSLHSLDNTEYRQHEMVEFKNVRGQALFLRAKSYLELAIIFCHAYDNASATSDLGVPLRLDPDFNKIVQRSNLQQTYNQIILDFKEAIQLLPESPLHLVRASKPAAYAYLARTYLAMRKYEDCLKYSDSCLQINNKLMDYANDSDIFQSGTNRVKRFNKEVLIDGYASSNSSALLGGSRARIDSNLYNSFVDDDCRKTVFFLQNSGANQGTFRFRGGYMNGGAVFTGIATDEVYLMRAECLARQGDASLAMNDLNALLIKRWKSGTFQPFVETAPEGALSRILIERRKELIFRGVRWMDIKRFNKDGINIILQRKIGNVDFILLANDPRFALAIPEDVILMSGLQQNYR